MESVGIRTVPGSASAASHPSDRVVVSFVVQHFKQLERSLGIRRRFLVGGLVILTILYLRGDLDYSMKSDLIGFLYPAYATILATESNPVRDAQKWMIYWVIFTSLSLLERYLVFMAFGYYLLKVVVLAWCMMPGDWSGCFYMYAYVIKPLVFKPKQQLSSSPTKFTN